MQQKYKDIDRYIKIINKCKFQIEDGFEDNHLYFYGIKLNKNGISKHFGANEKEISVETYKEAAEWAESMVEVIDYTPAKKESKEEPKEPSKNIKNLIEL